MVTKGRGGKRAGAGRPTVAGKSANFSTRITPETRAAIELEAKAESCSVSDMAERLLIRGLQFRREANRNDATRALGYLLSELAETVAPSQLKTANFRPDWRNDPFLYEALKEAFVKVMDALRPPGDPVAPPERDPALKDTTFFGPLSSVEERATYAATILLHNLQRASNAPQDMLSGARDTPKKLADAPYALHQAWVGLNGYGRRE